MLGFFIIHILIQKNHKLGGERGGGVCGHIPEFHCWNMKQSIRTRTMRMQIWTKRCKYLISSYFKVRNLSTNVLLSIETRANAQTDPGDNVNVIQN